MVSCKGSLQPILRVHLRKAGPVTGIPDGSSLTCSEKGLEQKSLDLNQPLDEFGTSM